MQPRSKRMRYRSEKREAEAAERTIVRELVFARDRWTCQIPAAAEAGRCFGPLTPHHIRKEGQGGAYEADNLVTLCAHHNGWVEDHPLIAHELGLVRRSGE